MGIRREHYVSIKKAVIDEDDAARYKQRREQAPAVGIVGKLFSCVLFTVQFQGNIQRKVNLS